MLNASYLIALLHISNENTAYLFEISRYIKYFETMTKHLLCGSQTRSGNPPPPLSPFFSSRILDSLMLGNILAKFEKNLSGVFFFRRMTLKKVLKKEDSRYSSMYIARLYIYVFGIVLQENLADNCLVNNR